MSGRVHLREVRADDLPIFWEQQLDPRASAMAAFPPREREPFLAHWRKILDRPENTLRTVLLDGVVAGNVVCFPQAGRSLVGYWIGREYWGRGVATRALRELVRIVVTRPLHAFVATHNVASIRVLEKCGFVPEDRPAAAPGSGPPDVEEVLFRLD